MRLKKGLPRLNSSKVMFRTFLATLKQIMQSYSGCITDCQQDFEKEKHLENTFQINILSMIMLSMILCS